MIVVSAANLTYKPLLMSLVRSVRYRGYKVHVWDVGNLGLGQKFEIPPPGDSRAIRRCKPSMMLASLELFKQRIVWVDADAVVRKGLEELESDDYDIAFPIKWKGDKFKPKSGIVFINNTEGAKTILKKWSGFIPKDGRGDQRYFRMWLESLNIPLNKKTAEGITLEGARIKFIDGSIYNYEAREMKDLDRPPRQVRVIAFCGRSGGSKFKDKLSMIDKYWM